MQAMWTVYDHPKDYPNSFVARLFQVDGSGAHPTASVIVAPTLDLLREFLEFELRLTCLTRSEEDEPQIVETWL